MSDILSKDAGKELPGFYVKGTLTKNGLTDINFKSNLI